MGDRKKSIFAFLKQNLLIIFTHMFTNSIERDPMTHVPMVLVHGNASIYSHGCTYITLYSYTEKFSLSKPGPLIFPDYRKIPSIDPNLSIRLFSIQGPGPVKIPIIHSRLYKISQYLWKPITFTTHALRNNKKKNVNILMVQPPYFTNFPMCWRLKTDIFPSG